MKSSYYLCQTGEVQPGQSKAYTINTDGATFEIALFNIDGKYYAISNTCQHKGGPLSKGQLNGQIVTCPWHGWQYSVLDGKSPHEGGDSVDAFEKKVLEGSVFVNLTPVYKGERVSKPHRRYSELEGSVNRYLDLAYSRTNSGVAENQIHVLGISTTNANDKVAPRQSTSESALINALNYSKAKFGAATVMVKLRQLYFKDCEGYYSKDSRACIFPCSISEMDSDDQMIEIYEKMIIWADVVIIASPIRWGSASSLYYKMVQRLNCVQNQMTTFKRLVIRDKIGAFIITGGQDNVQHVAGEMMSFWSQLGFVFGKFPFVGWTRGWYAEDTQNNYQSMNQDQTFKNDIERMVQGAVEMSRIIKRSRYDENLHQNSIA